MKHRIKKAAASFLTAAACLSFVSCFALDAAQGAYEIGKGVVDESKRHERSMQSQKEEMAALVEEYSPVFKEKAAEAYGSDAVLTDIRCVENFPEYKNDGYADYAKDLIATLTVDGKQYEAVLNCYGGVDHGRFSDTVHTDAICSVPVNALPLDKSRIVEVVYPRDPSSYDDYGEKRKFDWRIKTFDEWVTFGETSRNPMDIYIFTTEDVSGLSESAIRSAPEMQKMAEATSRGEITIVSLKDTEALDALKARMNKNSSAVSGLATSPYTTEESTRKFFDEFHMKSAMIIKNVSWTDREEDKTRELYIKVIK